MVHRLEQMHNFFRNLKEVKAGKNIWQNEHHAYDVYNHTLEFVRILEKFTSDPNLIVAGYLHDIGKPVVRKLKMKDGKVVEKEPGKPYHKFTGHEAKGEEMVLQMDPEIFKRFGLDQKKIAILVGAHYLPMRAIKDMRKATSFKEFLERFKQLDDDLKSTGYKEEVMLMFLADSLSKGSSAKDIEELKKIREAILNPSIEKLKQIFELQQKTYPK